jgi:hypothetical protein
LPCQHKTAAAAPAATTREPLFGHGDGDDRVVGRAPAGARYRYVTLFKRKNLQFVIVIGFGALWNRVEGLSLQNNQQMMMNTAE